MRFFQRTFFVGALSAANALNILVTNDDGFGTSNIRELYKAMKAFGHNVYIVASTTNKSGTGGTVVYTTSNVLQQDTEFGIVKAGAPSVGSDPNDSHIWYYNGTPSACVQVALDYVLPRYTNLTTFDLVLAGPNFGLNLGPFLYTISGTIGATYTAVERSIPAIAFSGGYSIQTGYLDLNVTTKAGLKDPATIIGQLSANLAQQLIVNAKGGRLLPLGYGINVNIPLITSFDDSSCVNPPFIHTRLTGGAVVDKAAYNDTTGLFSYADLVEPGTNQCINGDCSLPGEQSVLDMDCMSSVSVFTVDYDAPIDQECRTGPEIQSLLEPLVQSINSTMLVGGLGNGNSTVSGGNATVTPSGAPSPSQVPVSGAAKGEVGGVLLAAGLLIAFALS